MEGREHQLPQRRAFPGYDSPSRSNPNQTSGQRRHKVLPERHPTSEAALGPSSKSNSAIFENTTTRPIEIRLQKTTLANRPKAEFDNFYTPENNGFYSDSPYLPLNSTRQEIRLLRVFPRGKFHNHIQNHPGWAPIIQTPGQPYLAETSQVESRIINHLTLSGRNPVLLACELVDKVALARVHGNYCTLSYCAGKPSETRPILVDGLLFNAFANLEHAIHYALWCWTKRYPGKELLLWVDQICINQSDPAERAHQVGMMHEIYHRSYETFICLSDPGPSDRLSWALGFPNLNPSHNCRNSSQNRPGSGEDANIVSKLKGYLSLYFRQEQPLLNKDDLSTSELMSQPFFNDILKWLNSLQGFVGCPWWRRAWVYQEFIASPRPYFISRQSFIKWSDLSLLLGFIFSDVESFLNEISVNLFKESTIQKEQSKLKERQYRKCLKHQKRDLDEYNRRRYQEWREKWEEQQAKQKEYLSNEKALLKKEEERLRNTRKSMRTNSLQKKCELQQRELELKQRRVQLRLSIREQLVQVSSNTKGLVGRKLKKEREKLNQLQVIPDDWTRFSSTQVPPVKPDPNGYKLARKMQKEFERRRQGLCVIQEQIRRLDSSAISSVVRGKTTCRPSSDLKHHLRHSRNCASLDPRDRIYAFLNLASKGYAIVPDYNAYNTVVHVLIDTARRIIEEEKSLDILEHVGVGRDNLGHFLPTWVPDWTSQEVNKVLKGNSNRPFDASRGTITKAKFREDKTDDANLDVELEGIFVGKLDKQEYSQKRRLEHLQKFSTTSGHKAYTSRLGLLDDEVWILFGASKPVLLRQEPGNMYSFLGEVLMYDPQSGCFSDIMFGRMLQLAEQSKVVTKRVWIT